MASNTTTIKFPYPSFRRGQREVAEAVAKTVKSNNVLILQAPTGFGKTAAVLYGLLLAEVDRVLYVVRTRNEIEPVTRELTRFGVDYTFLYSARRMCPLLRRSGGEPPPIDEFWENCRLARIKGVCSYYNALSGIDVETVKNVIREANGDPFKAVKLFVGYGLCPFFALKMLLDDVRFIVATYPYFFKRSIFESVFEPHEYSDFVVVVDEAHSLMDAHTMVEEKLRIKDIEAAIKEIEEYAGEASSILESLHRLKRFIERVKVGDTLRRLDKRSIVDILGDPQNWIDLAVEIRLEKVKRILEERPEGVTAIRVVTAKIARFVEQLVQEDTMVYASKDPKQGVTIHVLPKSPCSVVGEPLSASKSAILMSGTMPPSSYVRDVLCVNREMMVYDVEMFHGVIYGSEARYVIVVAELTSRYTSRTSEMYQRYAEYIAETYNATNSAVLALYPSYEFMSEIIKRLPSDIDMIVEGKDTSISNVKEYVMRRRHVLINCVASGKLSEGVEFVDENGGSLIRTVFIAGVPYPQPDDLLMDFLAWLEQRVGRENSQYYVYMVTAAIRVKQALGRALRGPRDRAVFILADKRFLNPKLRELLRLKYNKIVYDIESYKKVLRGISWLTS